MKEHVVEGDARARMFEWLILLEQQRYMVAQKLAALNLSIRLIEQALRDEN
jgi:hypothetical protein